MEDGSLERGKAESERGVERVKAGVSGYRWKWMDTRNVREAGLLGLDLETEARRLEVASQSLAAGWRVGHVLSRRDNWIARPRSLSF